VIPSPDAIARLTKKLGREPNDEEMGELVAQIWREARASEKKRERRAARREMKPGDNCWKCRHLISKIHSRPPVYCRAFPKGSGIPMAILGGIVRHDHLLGDERDPVTFEPRQEGR